MPDKKTMTAPNASVGADAGRSPLVDEIIIDPNEKKSNKNPDEKTALSICTRAADVQLTSVDWLWYPYIPYGKVTIVKGDPGVGKSRFALDLAARITRGDTFPFREEERTPESVIYQTSEDDYQDTVIPRFISAGGNPSLLYYIDETENGHVTFTDERLVQAVKTHNARLLILDPLSSYIGDVSLNAANEVRPQFDKLISLARNTGCAIVIVTHLNKAGEKKLIYRTLGSIDVVGAVRSEITIDADPDDAAKKYLMHSKSNLAMPGSCIELRDRDDGTVEYVSELTDISAAKLYAELHPVGRPADRVKEVVDIITDMLSDGPRPAQKCAARLEDYAGGTITSAKKYLGVKSVKHGATWQWCLPEDEAI